MPYDNITKEQAYDAQISPLMTHIIEVCRARGIKMHASFELDGDMFCTTHLGGEGQPLPLFLMEIAAHTGCNFDAFMIAVIRYAQEHGHSSMILSLLDVPVTK